MLKLKIMKITLQRCATLVVFTLPEIRERLGTGVVQEAFRGARAAIPLFELF